MGDTEHQVQIFSNIQTSVASHQIMIYNPTQTFFAVLDRHIGHLHADCGRRWVPPLRSMVATHQIYDQISFQNVLQYLILLVRNAPQTFFSSCDFDGLVLSDYFYAGLSSKAFMQISVMQFRISYLFICEFSRL